MQKHHIHSGILMPPISKYESESESSQIMTSYSCLASTWWEKKIWEIIPIYISFSVSCRPFKEDPCRGWSDSSQPANSGELNVCFSKLSTNCNTSCYYNLECRLMLGFILMYLNGWDCLVIYDISLDFTWSTQTTLCDLAIVQIWIVKMWGSTKLHSWPIFSVSISWIIIRYFTVC